MPLIIPIIILVTSIPTYNLIKNKTTIKPAPKIERIQNYTMDQIKMSTLTEKYRNFDYPDGSIIEFNNCKHKVIDNKSGGRKFEPLGNCPPLILTPISYERYSALTEPTSYPTPTLIIKKQNIVKNDNYKDVSYVSQSNFINPDNSQYLRCIFPHSGTLILKKEECERLIDCQINDNLWTPLTREECQKKQKDYVEQKLKEIEYQGNELFNKNFNNLINPYIPPLPSWNFNSIPNEPTNLTNKPIPSPQEELTEEEKNECEDRISSYYRQLIKQMEAKFRARNIQDSSYAIQKERELLQEMNRKIAKECGF
jgi:hypothetical protein